ncbi:MAG: hypothetical protein P4L87_13580, partial [Formivibrio sp.]|nr:hypothetical protein [Formivibrio sp.]
MPFQSLSNQQTRRLDNISEIDDLRSGLASLEASVNAAETIVTSATTSVAAATALATPNTIVQRDASGNFSAGTITANVSGSATSFTGSLAGDVTGTQGATTVSNAAVIGKVLTGFSANAGTVAASDSILQGMQKLAGTLGVPTNSNTASQIVQRDASGNFSAGTITANLSGSATSFTGSLAGDVTGTQGATVVSNAAVIGKVLTGFSANAGTVAASDSILQGMQKLAGTLGAPTNLNTASQIVKRDASGNFAAGTITANLSGSATSFTGSLAGDVTGTQGATTVSNA